MATLLSLAGQDMFGPGHFAASAYTLAAASVASMDAGSPSGSTGSTAGSVRRPSSPPQPVPRPRQQQTFTTAHDIWEDALELGASVGSSDAEHFLDASSESEWRRGRSLCQGGGRKPGDGSHSRGSPVTAL